MKVEDYLLDNQNEIFGNDTSQFYEVEKHFKEYTKIKCQELLEIVAEKAEVVGCPKIGNIEVDKDSILNAVDLNSFCS